MTTIKTIKPGTTLKARSIGDADCIFTALVISRTKSFATVKAMNDVVKCKIFVNDEGVEYIYAHGRFSMAPIFKAI